MDGLRALEGPGGVRQSHAATLRRPIPRAHERPRSRAGRGACVQSLPLMQVAMIQLFALLAVAGAEVGGAIAAAPAAGQWPVHGGNDLEQRFSPLEQINSDTVSKLGLSWSFELDSN